MPTPAPAITAIPDFPSLADRATYNAKAFAWANAIDNVTAPELSALATNVHSNAVEGAASATTATNKALEAVNAANQAVPAAAAATQKLIDIEALYDQFDDRYLGSKSADPTLDNDGNALVNGAFYISSVSGLLRAYTTTGGWVQGISAVAGVSSVNGLTGAVAGIATTAANSFSGPQELATGAAIASAATVNLDAATGNRVHITGTTAISAFTLTRGPRTVIFDGILTLTHHVTNNNLPGLANITTAVGDRAIYEGDGATVYCVSYIRASGVAVVVPLAGMTLLSVVTASASATADIENTFGSTYDTYLIVASGIVGTSDNGGINCRLKIGGSYLATSTYNYHQSAPSSAAGTYGGLASALSTQIVVVSSAGITAARSANFTMWVHSPTSTTRIKPVNWVGTNIRSDGEIGSITGAGSNSGTGALTGVRFLGDSGTITGTFRLYGIAKV